MNPRLQAACHTIKTVTSNFIAPSIFWCGKMVTPTDRSALELLNCLGYLQWWLGTQHDDHWISESSNCLVNCHQGWCRLPAPPIFWCGKMVTPTDRSALELLNCLGYLQWWLGTQHDDHWISESSNCLVNCHQGWCRLPAPPIFWCGKMVTPTDRSALELLNCLGYLQWWLGTQHDDHWISESSNCLVNCHQGWCRLPVYL